MIQKWVVGIEQLSAVTTRFPHSAYAGLVSCLSAEWKYICHTDQCLRQLRPLGIKFLPAILGPADPIDDELQTLLGNEVKNCGLAFQDPTLTAISLYTTSIKATNMLAGTLICNEPIHIEAHQGCVRAAVTAHWKTQCNGEVAFHTTLMEKLPPKLLAIPNRFSGTKLTKDEWLDNIAIQYNQRPTNLPDQCDGCSASLTLEHGLSCKKGGLVGICHDIVVIKPTIFYGNGLQVGVNNANPTSHPIATTPNTLKDKARGDILAHGFWNHSQGTIFDIHICDMDSCSYGNTSSNKILKQHSKEKKDKYEATCWDGI
ncbi:hypothetical protein ACHAW6_006813 [Cyclotella cf. meneghiniana]